MPALDRELGLEVYLTDGNGIGGRLRSRLEDFVVEEIPLGFSSIEEFTAAKLSRVPSRYENYAIYLLEKRGIDTVQAASIIAQQLHLREEEVAYSGLKDSKAITRQLISLPFRRELQCEYEFPEGIMLKILGFRYRPLNIGELAGNQFAIAARGILMEENILVRSLDALSKQIREFEGVPGYFGYQRFGSRRPVSHLVGKMLVQGNVEEAVNILLTKSSEAESDDTRAAREGLAAEGDYEQASDSFPEHLSNERRMLEHLHKHPKDFEGALKKLPRRLTRLFVDAYQSFLYNKALSQWLRQHRAPDEVMQGDLVASFDEKGYAKRVTKVSAQNITKTRNDVEAQSVVPVLAVPAHLSAKPSHPISAEVASVLEEEKLQITRTQTTVKEQGEGLIRPVLVEPESLGWIISEDDMGLDARKATFHFKLKRGFYATMLMREFLKPIDPAGTGF